MTIKKTVQLAPQKPVARQEEHRQVQKIKSCVHRVAEKTIGP
ncbi:MAG: hypothetical protein NUV70_08490 [Caldiserica bacterium]|nr:hypothetical protein [Caldisericota bacterium]